MRQTNCLRSISIDLDSRSDSTDLKTRILIKFDKIMIDLSITINPFKTLFFLFQLSNRNIHGSRIAIVLSASTTEQMCIHFEHVSTR